MPYSDSSAARGIDVAGYTLTLEVSKRWAKPGDRVSFYGYLFRDETPIRGARIDIYLKREGQEDWLVGSAETDIDGYYQYDWDVPWEDGAGYTLPCRDMTFYAYRSAYDVKSNERKFAVAYPTRIYGLEAPDHVQPGETFKVKGYLEYEAKPDTWYGLGGRTVKIYYDDTLFGSGTTDPYGRFEVEGSIPESGSYTLKAVFEGEDIPEGAMGYAPATAEIPMRMPELGVIALIPVLVVSGAVIVSEVVKHAKIKL